jgi:Na+/melibiose symporter-like transporter
MSNEVKSDETKLKFFSKLGYGFGHVLNDLAATIWFSYTLLFLKDVELFGVAAGSLLMLGQFADAFFTMTIGILTDLFSTKRNWHLTGTILSILSFPSIFLLQRDVLPYWASIVYFAFMIIFFQCGWATVQVSHLAIIPEMATNEKERSELNAIRYSMSVIANITVFFVTYLFIHNGDPNVQNDEIGPKDFNKFRVRFLNLNFIKKIINFYL